MTTVAERCLTLRTALGWSRRTLALKLGINVTTLALIEDRLTVNPRTSTLVALRRLEGAYSDRLESHRLSLDPDDPSQSVS